MAETASATSYQYVSQCSRHGSMAATELELIRSALLPDESLFESDSAAAAAHGDKPGEPFAFRIESTATPYWLEVHACAGAEDPKSVGIDVKGASIGRDEALEWKTWSDELVRDHWQKGVKSGFPIYHLISEHFLPMLQSTAEQAHHDDVAEATFTQRQTYEPAHILFTSHHLLAPSKRKDLASLASRYKLLALGKVGHPGIIYAQGDYADLETFAREVKSWQWLALRMRVLERLAEGEGEREAPRARGSWEEVDKLGDAVAWLRKLGREQLLLDIGFGAGSGGSGKGW